MVPKDAKSFFLDYFDVYSQIDSDFGGGSPLFKTYLIAYLIKYSMLKTFVEIGVYRGKSFLPLAYIIKQNKGSSIGIDPYIASSAREYDLDEEKQIRINKFMDSLDFEQIYKDVLDKKEGFGLSSGCQIIRETSEKAYEYLKSVKFEIDMLHIDGNHDTKYVEMDAEKYIPMVKDQGFVVFDDIDWDSVNVVYKKYREQLITVFECETFAILLKGSKTLSNIDKVRIIERKLNFLYEKLLSMNKKIESGTYETEIPTVALGILTYNHENYIKECLDGVFCQEGRYKASVFILDDCSTDSTYEKICSYLKENSNRLKKFEIKVIRIEKNKGPVKILQLLTQTCRGFDYVSFCDGDDYWTNPFRIQRLIDFLHDNPECCISFNKISIFYQDKGLYEAPIIYNSLDRSVYNTHDILKVNVIGNQSCALYDGKVIDLLPDSLFELNIGDWMLNSFCSTYGDIGYIPEVMSIYRKHSGGIWSGLDERQRRKKMIKSIDEYNRYLDFIYDREYTEWRNNCIYETDGYYAETYDLVVMDDIFPSDLSGFRYQEFTSYLQEIKNTKVLCTGQAIVDFLKQNTDEVIIEYKRRFPYLSGNVCKYDFWRPIPCKLMYFVFPTNVYNALPIIERYGIPFVFTLYPGGGFALNNTESDIRLKRIMDSPYFKKVIVTQQVTYDYLLNKKYCTSDKVEFIFGVVMPLIEYNKAKSYTKKRYGIEKGILDICFIAQKYTKYGEDKGYDIFIETAKILCKMHENIHFHVVGGFDEKVIDISDIKNRITFYGKLNLADFDLFFVDKDIIISPNIDGKISIGTFDGFPTGSCVEAGLRKTALFCTDPLNLNGNRLINGEEIVIIPHDAKKISERIELYYNNAELLKNIGEKGQEKLLYLYSYDYQIAPRIKLLREEIEKRTV